MYTSPAVGLSTPKGPQPGSAAVRAPSVALSASKQERLETLRNERLRIMQAQASLLARPRSVARSAAGTPFGRPQPTPGPSDEIDKLKSEIRQLKINEELSKEKIRELESILKQSSQGSSDEVDRLRQQLAREKDRVFALSTEKQRLEEELQHAKVDKFKNEQLESEVKALKVQLKDSGSWREERESLLSQLENARKDCETVRNQYKTEKSQRLVLASRIEQLEKDLRDADLGFERRPTLLASETVGVIAWKGPSPKHAATDYSPKSQVSGHTLPSLRNTQHIASGEDHYAQNEKGVKKVESFSPEEKMRTEPVVKKTDHDEVNPKGFGARQVVKVPFAANQDEEDTFEPRVNNIEPKNDPVTFTAAPRVESFVDPFAAGEEEFLNEEAEKIASSAELPVVPRVESFVDPFAAGEDEYIGTPQRQSSLPPQRTSEPSFLDVEQRGSAKKSAPDISSIFGPASPLKKLIEPEQHKPQGWAQESWELPPTHNNYFETTGVQGFQNQGQQGQVLGSQQFSQKAHVGGAQPQEAQGQFGYQTHIPVSQSQSRGPFGSQGQVTGYGQVPPGPFGHLPAAQTQGPVSQQSQGQFGHQTQVPLGQTQGQYGQVQTPGQGYQGHPQPPMFSQSQPPMFQNKYQPQQPAPIHPVMKQTIPGRPSPGSSPKETPLHAQYSPPVPQQYQQQYAVPQHPTPAPQSYPAQYGSTPQQHVNQSPFGQPPQFRQGPPSGPFRY